MGQVSEALWCELPDSQRSHHPREMAAWLLHQQSCASQKNPLGSAGCGRETCIALSLKNFASFQNMLWKYLLVKSHGDFLWSIFFLGGFSIDRRSIYACKIMLHRVWTLEKRRSENCAEKKWHLQPPWLPTPVSGWAWEMPHSYPPWEGRLVVEGRRKGIALRLIQNGSSSLRALPSYRRYWLRMGPCVLKQTLCKYFIFLSEAKNAATTIYSCII